VNDGEDVASDAARLRHHDGSDQRRGHRRIDRVATSRQDAKTGASNQWVGRRDHAAPAVDRCHSTTLKLRHLSRPTLI